MIDDTSIPTIAVHRNIPIHDHQSEERIKLVKREIDLVLDQIGHDFARLIEWAASGKNSPESRMVAAAMAAAIFESNSEARQRTNISPGQLRALTHGLALDDRTLRCQHRYTSILDWGWKHAVLREMPLPAEAVG
jgi:hypothetical protein